MIRIVLLMLLCALAMPVSAHANLVGASPGANHTLTTTPPEIRLTFSEPVELAFSRVSLRNSRGETVELPAPTLREGDATVLIVVPPPLADDVYTVTWRVASATDGHITQGSFAFSIGMAGRLAGAVSGMDAIAPDASLVRAFNLMALGLLAGLIGFQAVVWPGIKSTAVPYPRGLLWGAWAAVGLASVLLLLLQTATFADVPLGQAAAHPALAQVVTGTRIGAIWLARMALWLLLGFMLWRGQGWRWCALVAGLMLLTQSLTSHSSGNPDGGLGVLVDLAHLTATSLWIGGLVALAWALWRVRGTPAVRLLTRRFGHLARLSVVVLVLSGMYMSYWLIGSFEALTQTTHGQALLVKWALFVPLLLMAGVNLLLLTPRLGTHLRWEAALRRSVRVEVLMGAGALLAVGIMTSVQPARDAYAAQLAAASQPSAPGFFGMETVSEVMIHLEILPLQIGENEFIVTLFDQDGAPITDARRIRMRFQNPVAGVATSELRPTLQPDSSYRVTGSNLSQPGDWRIRMTISRPQAFDLVADFNVTLP